MKRIHLAVALFIAALLAVVVVPAAIARADVAVTPSATTVTVGDTLTVTVPAATTFVQGGWIWQGASTTGACTSVRSGSYTNGGQVITYTCTGPDVLTAVAATSGTFTLPSGSITVNAAPVVTPPPAPVAHYVITTTGGPASLPYRVTITNDGNATGTTSYADTYVTPSNFTTAISAPAFTSCAARRILNPRTHRYTVGNGFVCTGAVIAAGASVVIEVTA